MRQLGQKGKSEEWRTKRAERRDQLKSSTNAIFATIRDFSSKRMLKRVNEFPVLGVDIETSTFRVDTIRYSRFLLELLS